MHRRRHGRVRFGGMLLAFLAIALPPLGLSDASSAWGLTLEGRVSEQREQPPEPAMPGIVGLQFEIRRDHYPEIVDVYPGTPAARAGLQPGDRVVAIDGASTMNLTAAQVDQAISDIPGQAVRFAVSRQERYFMVTLTVARLADIRSPQIRLFYARMIQP